ncbi:MAG: PAS domain S-box protein [Desulfobacterales bacterium]|nr:PAS domain S-box protein [Desulfobacterales bacterium]
MSEKPTYEELELRIRELENDKLEIKRSKDEIMKFRTIADKAAHGYTIVELDGTIVYLNDFFAKLHGYSANELIGKNLSVFHNEKQLENVQCINKNLINSRNYSALEVWHTHKDGTEFLMLMNAVVINDDNGAPEYLGATGIDITNRKMSETALYESQAKLVRSQYLSKMGDFTWEISTGFVTWSEGMHRLLGYDLNEKINYAKVNLSIHHPDDLKSVTKWLNDSIASGNEDLITNEYRLVCKNGEVIEVRTVGQIEYCDGVAVKLFGTCQDITELKQTEQALRYEKKFINMAIDSLPGIFYLFTKEGKFLRWNDNFEKVSGYSALEISTMKPRDFFPVEEHAIVEERISEVFKKGSSFVEANWLSKNGTKKLYYLTGVCVDIGSALCQVGMGIDISDRKLAEQERKKFQDQLQHSQKMEAIATLAGGIAHDFNNMLGVITGNTSFALSILSKKDELFEVLSDIKASSKQAQTLTHQLLIFSKGGAPIKKTVDINKLINEASVFSIRGSKSKCNFELSDDLWRSEVDEGQINQVIGNLIINANQAMPNGGIITIKTDNIEVYIESVLPLSSGSFIRIVVEDQGIGIHKKHLSKIFEPYFSTKQKGSGLGLATTYSIIKRHGGHINVHSEIEKGTYFSVYLPASSKCTKPVEDKGDPIHAGNGKILIMDDQESILKMVGRMLNHMGYETIFATDGTQAVELFRDHYKTKNHLELVILDLTIPGGMGGLKTIIELLKIDPNVKAVVSSGYSNDQIMANYEDYGFCGIVPKPYTKGQLAEVLNRILA